MRSLPFGFTTVTIELTQSVASWTLSITPRRSIRWSSALTFGRMVTGTFRGGCTTGMWLGSVWMWCVTPDMQPRPVNVSAYLLKTSFDRVSTRFTRPSSSHVPSPSTLDTLSTTSNSMGLNLFLCSHKRTAFPTGVMRCPPNATSLAFDLERGCLLACMKVSLDMTLHWAPVSILNLMSRECIFSVAFQLLACALLVMAATSMSSSLELFCFSSCTLGIAFRGGARQTLARWLRRPQL